MALTCFASPATAETFCVNTPLELHTAIGLSEANAEQDEIRIATGTYASSDRFAFESNQPHKISFRGGYSPNCSIPNEGESRIDGQSQRIGLEIHNLLGDIVVENLTFLRGSSFSNDGGGLHVESDTGDIRIDRNRFYANEALRFGGALNALTREGLLTVRSNLAIANSAGDVGAFVLKVTNGLGYVVGNTITGNSSSGGLRTGGLAVVGNGSFFVSNNIIWRNLPDQPEAQDCDFLGAANHDRHFNDIGIVSSASNPGEIIGEVSVDPQFVFCGYFCIERELMRSSPLVDAGNNSPDGGMTSLDLAGKPRTVGAQVDIGAYENELLFADDFD